MPDLVTPDFGAAAENLGGTIASYGVPPSYRAIMPGLSQAVPGQTAFEHAWIAVGDKTPMPWFAPESYGSRSVPSRPRPSPGLSGVPGMGCGCDSRPGMAGLADALDDAMAFQRANEQYVAMQSSGVDQQASLLAAQQVFQAATAPQEEVQNPFPGASIWGASDPGFASSGFLPGFHMPDVTGGASVLTNWGDSGIASSVDTPVVGPWTAHHLDADGRWVSEWGQTYDAWKTQYGVPNNSLANVPGSGGGAPPSAASIAQAPGSYSPGQARSSFVAHSLDARGVWVDAAGLRADGTPGAFRTMPAQSPIASGPVAPRPTMATGVPGQVVVSPSSGGGFDFSTLAPAIQQIAGQAAQVALAVHQGEAQRSAMAKAERQQKLAFAQAAAGIPGQSGQPSVVASAVETVKGAAVPFVIGATIVAGALVLGSRSAPSDPSRKEA